MNKCAAFCLTLLASFVSAQSQPSSSAAPLWITNVFLVSPDALDHIEKGSVLIEGGRIAKVERNQSAKPPSGATVFDGRGEYLIPGLIDSHVHLASVPGMSAEQENANPAMVKEYFR